MMQPGVVIVGAGQGGIQAAISLREAGYAGSVIVLNDEGCGPYQRPPLSKAFMLHKIEAAGLQLRNADYYAKMNIELRGARATSIDRGARVLMCEGGDKIPYETLVIATGGRNRSLNIPGIDLAGVFSLRTMEDAARLREKLRSARQAVVVGAGFIGLEFAAVAAANGVSVHVVEAGDRPMARAVSPDVSRYFTQAHMRSGTTFTFGDTVVALEGRDGAVTGVRTAAGEELPADLVVLGIGLLANDGLAVAAGLATENGVIVDSCLRTDDPHIYAIGDCAVHPNVFARGMARVESVQNAVDHGRCVAASIMGSKTPYGAVPWFWSDQGTDKLQIAGIGGTADEVIVSGDVEAGRFSAFRFRDGALACVESVNKAADHMAARTLLKSGHLGRVTARDVAKPDFQLKQHVVKEAAHA